MTYKTRQEVLRAAADWIDVCEKAGVEAVCKWTGIIKNVDYCAFDNPPEQYEFPLALIEGKEVWVGNALYFDSGTGIIVTGLSSENVFIANNRDNHTAGLFSINRCSWNPPKPKTVMVEMLVEDAESVCKFDKLIHMTLCGTPTERLAEACKKALENLK